MNQDNNDASSTINEQLSKRANRKNILLILVDQFRFPRFSYGPDAGFSQPIKLIAGFQDPKNPDELDQEWAKKFYPGLWALRQNSVVLRRHYIAASACTPSRATIMTGQYGTRTGVTQTDGTFKNGDSPAFPWLDPYGVPTIGSWMREAGYSTHYFGKWHVSNPPDQSLKRYGFDDWELSYPEPHGTLLNNLGAYRDYQFADLCAAFLRRRGLGEPYARFVGLANYNHPIAVTANRAHQAGLGPDILGGEEDGSDLDFSSQDKPWFSVISFTNPHDIAVYPTLLKQLVDKSNFATNEEYAKFMASPLGVPEQGWVSSPPQHGTMQFELNPLGFPTGSGAANVPPTMLEDLSTKPRCQYDSSYKVGLTLASKLGWSIASANIPPGTTLEQLWHKAAIALRASGLPFNLQEDPVGWCTAFIRYYAYLTHVVDEHITRVLTALRDSGQEENTIVIFTSDHGEYGGAHGMLMEKWYAAYEEAVHVPVVIHSAAINPDPNMKQCDALTSHIDMLPTILGFAGVDEEGRNRIRRHLRIRNEVPEPVGVNIAPLIERVGARPTTEPSEEETVLQANGKPRRGVLFITDDEITAPLPEPPGDPHSIRGENEYQSYKIAVNQVAAEMQRKGEQPIAEGSVIQPNHVRCVVSAGYKLARYIDPDGQEAEEWEMYDLVHDANETTNLLVYNQPFPTVISSLPHWADTAVEAKARELRELLADLEATML